MGEQIVTQYENYQELLLDLDIFGRLSSTKQMNLDEYKDLFFEEFKKQKPMPTMESKRYELSRLVDNSYRVEYNRQLELRENERLVDFNEELEDENVENKTNRKLEDIDIDNNVKILFQYENQVCDRDREEIIKKYLATMIFVEISDSGYIIYYIPERWEDIHFETTGLDVEIPNVEYGRLVLNY